MRSSAAFVKAMTQASVRIGGRGSLGERFTCMGAKEPATQLATAKGLGSVVSRYGDGTPLVFFNY